ncbi:MAG: carboxypeptidase-like regulatory domain-containing protein [Candidatus Acidiferrales bacterium]
MNHQQTSRLLAPFLLATTVLVGWGALAQQSSTRTVRGQVLDENNKAVENAIVHLKNLSTKKELSVVSDKEGRYQFNDVDMKVDHEIQAEWRQQKSRARKISQFDTRPKVTINLPLEPPKETKKD